MEPRIDSDNALAEKTVALIDRLRPHANTILAAVGAAALAIVAWLLIANQVDAGRARSWDAFLDAVASDSQPVLVESLGDVMRRYPGTAAAQWAELVLADFAVSEGTDLLFANTDRARERLRAAVDAYSAVLAGRPRGLLASRATFGLAKARESLGELAEARLGYEAVAREQSAGGFADLAAGRASALGRESTRQWYDWFAAQTFTPPQSAAPGGGAAQRVEPTSEPAAPAVEPATESAAEPAAPAE